MSSKMNIDLDLMLSYVGGFGKYQILIYILLCIPIFFNGFATLSYVFTAGNLDYRCFIPECDQSSPIYDVPWFSNAIPQRTTGASSKCTYYVLTRNVSNYEECDTSINLFDSSTELTCNRYVYETDEVTIVNESVVSVQIYFWNRNIVLQQNDFEWFTRNLVFNLHCEDNEWMLALVGTMNNIGLLIFMPISGYLSDRFGRKRMLIIAFICTALFGLLRSFSVNYYMFIATEFLEAGLGSVTFTAIFILGMEILCPTKRVLGTVIIVSIYTAGLGTLGVIALLTRNFRTLLRIIYAPVFLFITYIWLLPESLRWLVMKHRYEEASKILQNIAKVNNVELPTNVLQQLHEQDTAAVCDIETKSQTSSNDMLLQPNKDNLMTVFKSPFLIIRLLSCSFCWFSNTFVFFGLNLNSVSLAGNKYVNYLLTCFVDVPTTIVLYFILNRCSRRWCQSLALILSGIACLLSQIEIQISAINLILFLIGKCAIAFSFTVLHIYTVELFPTSLRHTLMTICSMVGRIGSTLAPLTPLLRNVMTQLPLILFGGAAILSGLLALQFPDTLNIKLPDTVAEAEQVGQQKKK